MVSNQFLSRTLNLSKNSLKRQRERERKNVERKQSSDRERERENETHIKEERGREEEGSINFLSNKCFNISSKQEIFSPEKITLKNRKNSPIFDNN